MVAGFYRRLHVPALPQLRRLSSYVDRWTDRLAALPPDAPLPRRLVEQAVSLGRSFVADGGRTRGPSTATCTTRTCWPATASRGW